MKIGSPLPHQLPGAYTRVNNHVADAHILHKCGRIVAHEADAAVALLDDTVRDDHVADMAVTVADDNCLRAGTQHAVRDDDVLARFCPIRNAGKRNAVVAARNMAIGNNNTFTARNMDAIVVRHVEAGVNRKAKQLYTLTRVEAERPARRVDNLNAAHSNILCIVEEDALARRVPMGYVHSASCSSVNGTRLLGTFITLVS